ncbi:type II toxin-antitoxin system Phd/YefM family antitoxin [Promicromonospora sp. Populi]|uniref:type II toxin-antitoxin system Phd/YefM family antitoxin n=1 Tax=Promicromonospora sp. Populi TaxID=3239420 RepID=UPI0034E21B8D
MNSVSIAELRQNPTPVLDAVERGETYVVTRYRKEIARLVPVVDRRPVSGRDVMAALRRTPLEDGSWADEIAADRAAFDAEWVDPWGDE